MSANSNLPLSIPQPFNGENYQFWSIKMQSYLEAFDLWEVTANDIPLEPLPRNPTMAQIKAHTEEKTKRSKAKTVILNSVADSVFPRIMACKSAKEAWDKLKIEYQGSDRTRKQQALNLKRQFEALTMGDDESVSKYSDRISLIVNKIRLLGEDFAESRVVEKILVTLPERFESKISSLEESKDLSIISMAELISALQAQEQRREMRQHKFIEGALIAKNNNFGGGKKNTESSTNGNKFFQKFPPCSYCKKTNHLPAYCWWRPDAKCNKCGQLGHVEIICKSQTQAKSAVEQVYEEELMFIASCRPTLSLAESWLIDSGCTNHMTYDRDLFRDLDTTYTSKVKIGNGMRIAVAGKGTIAFKGLTGLKLISDVLYVPEIDQNLLSVGQLLEKGYRVIFEDKSCLIREPDGKDLFKIQMKSKIFSLNFIEEKEVLVHTDIEPLHIVPSLNGDAGLDHEFTYTVQDNYLTKKLSKRAASNNSFKPQYCCKPKLKRDKLHKKVKSKDFGSTSKAHTILLSHAGNKFVQLKEELEIINMKEKEAWNIQPLSQGGVLEFVT